MGGLAAMSRGAVQSVTKSGYADGDGFGYGQLPILGGVPSSTGINISQATAINVSTVYACIMTRAKDVARCTPRILPATGARSQEPDTKHPLAKIFKRPNGQQTWFEFCVQMHAGFLLRGNAYAVILRDGRGNPTEMIPINPDAVTVREASDGLVFYNVARYGLYQMHALRNLAFTIPEEDVFHLKALSFNALIGVSTIGIARDSIGVAMGLDQQAARFMANGARPSGVLMTDKALSTAASDRLRDQWNSLRAGISNVGGTAILEEGVKFDPLSLTSVDLEFIAQRKFQIEDIARWWGIPLHKLGVAGEVGKLRLDQADQAYVNATIMPDLDMWEQKFIQKFDLDTGSPAYIADFDERRLLRAEEATRINNQRLKVMSGLATPNECRAEEGLPPMPGGDVLMFPVNIAALGSDVSGSGADGAGRPQAGDPPPPTNGSVPGDGAQGLI